MKKLLLLPLLLLLTGCKKPVTVHPGAISNLDSYSYDVLLAEQATITQAKAEFTAGQLPASAKTPLNAAIAQYNVTQGAWQAYHASGNGATTLQQALETLVAAVAELIKVMPNKNVVQPMTSEVWNVQSCYA